MGKFLDQSGVSYLWSKAKAFFAAKEDLNELSGKVDDIVAEGGEPNVITAVKVNGTAQAITDKAVNITVPTKTSQITNDSGYQTNAEVKSAVDGAINKFMTDVSDDDTVNTYKELVDYAAEHKGEAATFAGDIAELKTDVAGKVDKVTGKGLSANDYTDAEKEKLEDLEVLPDRSNLEAGSYLVHTPVGLTWAEPIEAYTHPTHTAKASGFYKVTVDALGHVTAATAVTKSDITGLGIPAQDTTYSVATQSANGLLSSADKKIIDGISTTYAKKTDVETLTNADIDAICV